MLIEDFKLEKWINSREDRTKIDLSATCPKVLSLKVLTQITGENFSKMSEIPLNYGQLHGTKRLKQAICNLYENVNLDNVTVTLGGIGANYLVLQTLVNKADKVVCVCPCYQQMYTLPKNFGANVELFFLNEDWTLDIEQFKAVVGEDTKLICVTNPNNPTGMNSDLTDIVKVARGVGAYLFVDEVYRGLNHSETPYSKSAVDLYDKAIVTGSMSKTYSLAGIRLGWIVANKNIIEQINSNREYNTISISALDDYVATIALENHDKIVDRNLKIILENKKILSNFINLNSHFSWIEPNAGTIACVKFDYDLTSEDFCAKLFDDTGVLTIPASCFDMQQKFFRIGYAMDSQILQNSLNSISDWIRKIY
mgnify:FL=1